MNKLSKTQLYAWIGEDEFGSGQVGIKQGIVPAGCIPIVSISREKLDPYWNQAEKIAEFYGKKIFLCRFELVEVVRETMKGDPL